MNSYETGDLDQERFRGTFIPYSSVLLENEQNIFLEAGICRWAEELGCTLKNDTEAKEMTRLTDNSIRREPSPKVTVAISMAVYGMALCGGMLLIGLYHYRAKPSWGQFLLSPSVILCMVAVLGLLVASGVLVRFLCGSQGRNRYRRYAVIMSLLVIVLVGGIGEAALRIAAVERHNGTFVGHFRLLPRQWREFVDRYWAMQARASQIKLFTVSDDTLGWTVEPNRKSEDGLNATSAEGLRSATQGEVLRHGLGDCRVALVGDSFTFGFGVRFEDSWAYRLEQLLPKGCRVLNFGVPGYGVDQMYLRYRRDVPSWKPNLVILSFIDPDLDRTMSSYGFLIFEKGGLPKPRFVLDQGGTLNIVNQPLPKVEDIFLLPYIHDVPFIEYDQQYKRTDWDRPQWCYVHRSYFLRFLISIYPFSEKDRPFVSDADMRALNSSLLNAFVAAVHKDGATPLLVYLPNKRDFKKKSPWISEGLQILQNAQLEHVDLTSCLKRDSEPDHFITKGEEHRGHYTPQANAAVAACLGQIVQDRLGRATAE